MENFYEGLMAAYKEKNIDEFIAYMFGHYFKAQKQSITPENEQKTLKIFVEMLRRSIIEKDRLFSLLAIEQIRGEYRRHGICPTHDSAGLYIVLGTLDVMGRCIETLAAQPESGWKN